MKTLRIGLYPAGRLYYGAAVVAAADSIDVSPVQKRFDAFAQVQQFYMGAYGTVQAAVTALRERRTVLTQLDLAQDDAIEEVACRLALDGQPRANPFAAYGVDTPAALKELNFGEKAKAIHTLVGMVHADTTLGAATQHAVQAAEETARQMETELIPFANLQTSLRTARAAREAAGKKWDKALTALKLDARAADAESALGLENALLGHLNHSKKPAAADKKPVPVDKQQTTGGAAQAASAKQETTDRPTTPTAASAEVTTS